MGSETALRHRVRGVSLGWWLVVLGWWGCGLGVEPRGGADETNAGMASGGGPGGGRGQVGGGGGAGGNPMGGGVVERAMGGGVAGSVGGGGIGVPGGGGAAGGQSLGRVGLFVAIGHVNRSMVSCDEGQTWVANRSNDDSVRCFSSAATDCDHKFGAGRGIVWTPQGGFVANWGWGDPGVIRKSLDGVTWTTVDSGQNYAAMTANRAGLLYAASGRGKLSRDDGKTWVAAGDAKVQVNIRRGGFGGTGNGVFVIVGDSNTARVSDDAVTWRAPQVFPSSCANEIQWEGGIASGSGVMVVLGGDGNACRSTDNGVTFDAHSVGGSVTSRLLWTGREFVAWGNGAMYRSPNGTNWTSSPLRLRRNGALVSGTPSIGAVAMSPTGAFVASNAGWQVWYEKQRFYRSVDGLTWDELNASRFVGSHPISHIAYGEGAKPEACP